MNRDTTLLLVIVGGVALLFWAMSRGLLGFVPTGITTNPQTGVRSGGIATPQPATNYSGFLAASTAPSVASALDSAVTGIGGLFGGWFGGGAEQASTVGQSANSASPTLSAQPQGPSSSAAPSVANVGPQISSTVSYDATTASAYGWADLSADNAYDPNYSLQGA